MGAFVNDSVVGIVYFKLGDPTGKTYINKFDQEVPAETLTNDWTPMAGALAVQTATQSCGRPGAFSYWVRVNITEGGTVSVRLLCQYGVDDAATYGIDLAGASPTNWGEALQLVDQNDGTTANEFTLTTGVYLFQTASAHTTGLLRWEAKYNDRISDGSFVRIAGRVA